MPARSLWGLVFFSWPMHTLFAISMVCLTALVGAWMTVARHIRSGRVLDEKLAYDRRDFAQYLVAAAADEGFLVPRSAPRQTVKDVAARKSWNRPPELVTILPSAWVRHDASGKTGQGLQGTRKSLRNSHEGGLERLDRAYFNKDLGDLTDPYETPRIRVDSRTSSRR